jgi:hypothetical protein
MAKKRAIRPRDPQPDDGEIIAVLRTNPPTVMTRGQMRDYFHNRGTYVRITHIPATNPQEERIDAEIYRK